MSQAPIAPSTSQLVHREFISPRSPRSRNYSRCPVRVSSLIFQPSLHRRPSKRVPFGPAPLPLPPSLSRIPALFRLYARHTPVCTYQRSLTQCANRALRHSTGTFPRYLRAGVPVRATEQPYLILTIPLYVCNTSCSQYLSFKDHLHRTACSPQVPVVHFLPWKSFRHLHKVIWTLQRLISHEILLELCQLLRPGVRAGLNLLRQHPKSNPRRLLLDLKAYLLPRHLRTLRHPKLSLWQLVIRLPRSRYLQNAHHDRKDPLHFASCLSTTQTRLLLTPRGPPGGGETPQDHNRPLDPPQIKSSRSTSSCRSCRGVHLAWTIYTRCTSMPLLSSQGQPSRRSIQPFLLTFYCHLYPLECQGME